MQVLESAAFERVESFFYKYSYALMDAQPTRTVTAWMSKPGTSLTPQSHVPPRASPHAQIGAPTIHAQAHPRLWTCALAGLNPTRLIPALVRYLQRQDDDPSSSGQRGVDHSMATRYLEHCIATSKGHADPAIYNYLLQVRLTNLTIIQVMGFIAKGPGGPGVLTAACLPISVCPAVRTAGGRDRSAPLPRQHREGGRGAKVRPLPPPPRPNLLPLTSST